MSDGLQPPITPVPGYQKPSSGLCGHLHTHDIYSHKHSPVYVNNNKSHLKIDTNVCMIGRHKMEEEQLIEKGKCKGWGKI